MNDPRVLVIGRQSDERPPGLPPPDSRATFVFADDARAARERLGSCDVVFLYGEPRGALREAWGEAGSVRWIHVASVGVDGALFPQLVESEVAVTNSRGVFDVSLSEYVVSLMLALAKDLPRTLQAQAGHRWDHHPLDMVAGTQVVIVGAGSIARATARLLRAMGATVTLVGRSERPEVGREGLIRGVADLPGLLPEADWLVVAAPLTAGTRGLIGSGELGLLPSRARLVNVGRGPIIDEVALIAALATGALAGAALDVFETEPLPGDSPLWSMPHVIISPHIGGDVPGTPDALVAAFLANLERYLRGEPLRDVVDKRLGYVPDEPGP